MIIDEIKNIESSRKKLREFGLLIGAVLIIIALFLFYSERASFIYFGAAGGLLILAGLLSPKVLLPFQKTWMILSVILGYFSTRLILGILFYIVITPMGIAAKLFGKDFLERKLDKKSKSYWHYNRKKEYDKEETERQF